MTEDSRVGIRLLKTYVVAAATLLIVLALAAFRQAPATTRFEEIDVERLNVVEKDGKKVVTRVGYRFDDEGNKIRVAKRTGEDI